MHDFHSNKLPLSFETFFLPVKLKNGYNIRLALKNSYSLPLIRTNYGKFSIRFHGSKIWKDLDEELKTIFRYKFKKTIISNFLNSYELY